MFASAALNSVQLIYRGNLPSALAMYLHRDLWTLLAIIWREDCDESSQAQDLGCMALKFAVGAMASYVIPALGVGGPLESAQLGPVGMWVEGGSCK